MNGTRKAKCGPAALVLLAAGISLLSACSRGAELPWAASFASAEQQFQMIRQAEGGDGASAQSRVTFEHMQGLWGRISRAQSGMMRGVGHMHNGAMMGRRGGMGMIDQATIMQFNEMNQEMLSYCLGMQQMMNRSGRPEMAAMYGRMAERMGTMLSRMPPSAGSAAPSSEGPTVSDGAATFASNCASCHGVEGQGVGGVFPPLSGSSVAVGPAATIVKIVLQGLQGPLTVAGVSYNGFMPAFEGVLSDEQIAAALTYVRAFPSNGGAPVTADDVRGIRAATASRSQPWTSSELGLR